MYKLEAQFMVNMNNGKSDNNAVFQGDKYRITILTERLIRFEYSDKGEFVDSPSQLAHFRKFSVPKIEVNNMNKVLEISTKYFQLVYGKDKPFSKSSLRVALKNADRTWYYGHPEARNYYGASGSLDDLDGKVKYKRGLYSADGFVSIDDSKSLILSEDGSFAPRKNEKNIDIYLFMYRKDFGLCLTDYFKLTGRPPMIPRYAFGNWWSKEEKYDASSSYKLIKMFSDHEIPVSVFLMDKDWHVRETEKIKDIKSSYTFNKKLFSAPYEFIEALHKKNIKVGLRIDPNLGISAVDANYNKAKEFLGYKEDQTIPYNVMDSKFVDAYFKLFIHPIDMLALDFWWLDTDDKKLDKNHLSAMNYYQFLDSDRSEKKRGMILSRTSEIAPHRYPVLYSGKTLVSWETLKELPYLNASSSNIGVSYWSHDIGGAQGGIEDPELYLRYVQFGCFSPIFRFHTEKGPYYKREPWLWDAATREIVSRYMRLRHKLIPYLYSASYNYYSKGLPIIQPIYYKFPEMYDDLIYRNQYYLGTEFMIAPIIEKQNDVMNRAIKRIFVPDGIWYHFQTGKRYPGGKTYTTFYKNEEYPIFCRGGSIIPLAINKQINNTDSPDSLEVHVFPGRSNTYRMYEDDGYSNLYKKGYYIVTSFDYNYRKSNHTLIIRPVEGKSGIIPENRNYKVRFRNSRKPDDIVVYEGSNQAGFKSYIDGEDFVVELESVSTLSQITINCKGKDIEIDAIHILNEEIESILVDLMIETKIKEKIADIIFSDLSIRKKRIEIRKLRKYKLDKRFIDLFLKLLEYMVEI